jgi:hypothetical protein
VAAVGFAYVAWCLLWPALRVVAFSPFVSCTCGLAGLAFCAGACFDGMDVVFGAARSVATFIMSHVAHTRRGLHHLFIRAAARLAQPATPPPGTPEAPAAPPRAPSHAATSIRRKLYAVFCEGGSNTYPQIPPEAAPEPAPIPTVALPVDLSFRTIHIDLCLDWQGNCYGKHCASITLRPITTRST